ncbi:MULTISPECIES: hypothetical protein [unclassified Pseudomonas]|uniref:hypothetical protein n=2 Tax=unclassified Pseudomonas TaxID=196821 RepID=UPI0011AEC675|nr:MULTISPECIES: hypothetical protein [unclassified Pseudomonas]
MTRSWQRPTAISRPLAISPSLLAVVQNVLSMAWRVLMDEVQVGAFSLCSATEDEITERLQFILGDLHAADDAPDLGFLLFETPVREGNLRNYNGESLDRQPDLAFRPLRGHIKTTNSVPAAIFVECKPIDSAHPVKGTYCRAGLIRFVKGDYSWAVDRALMVGYVRNICQLPGGLSTCFDDISLVSELHLGGALEALPSTVFGDAVCQSKHDRFFLLEGGSSAAGVIAVHHLWFHPEKPCESTRCRGVT